MARRSNGEGAITQRIGGEWLVSGPKTMAGLLAITSVPEAVGALGMRPRWSLRELANGDKAGTGR